MKKKVWFALVTLCCPLVLNTQQVFADEVVTESTETSEVEVAPEAVVPAPEEILEAVEPTAPEAGKTAESTETKEETKAPETAETKDSTTGVKETDASGEEAAKDASEASEKKTFNITYIDAETGAVLFVMPITAEIGTPISIPVAPGFESKVGVVPGSGFAIVEVGGEYFFQGLVTADLTEVLVVVEASSFADNEVCINYVDEAGNPVIGAPDVLLSGAAGEDFTYEPVAIPGYTYTGGTITGTFTDEFTVINVVYTRIETTVRVSYLDDAGNQLAADEFYNGKYGEVYEFTPATFFGMKLVSINGLPMTEADLPMIVEMGETDQHFVVVYTRATAPTTPKDPATPKPGQPSQVQPVVTVAEPKPAIVPVKKDQPAAKTLPATGEKENMMATAAGVILVAQAAYVLKKKKENEFGM